MEINFTAQGVGFCHWQRPFLGRELNLLSALKRFHCAASRLKEDNYSFHISCNILQFEISSTPFEKALWVEYQNERVISFGKGFELDTVQCPVDRPRIVMFSPRL